MPVIKRSVDEHPAPEMPLWRYIDLSQLVSLLERNQLWFSRADKLGDPFEGSLTEPQREVRDEQIRALHEFSREEDDWTEIDRDPEEIIEHKSENQERQREWVFINCWHRNSKESAAMWDLYSKSNDAVAIKTNLERLVLALSDSSEDVSLSKVKYLDFEEDEPVTAESTIDFLIKRKSFAHEREVRAIVWDVPELDEEDDQPPGHRIDVDLKVLIDEIRISPDAPDWFAETVRRMLGTYNFSKNIVQQSDLAEDPLF